MTDRDPGSMERAFEALRSEVETARVPPDLFARIAQRARKQEVQERNAPRRWWPALAASAAVAVALLALAAALWWRPRPVELAGFQVASSSADFRSSVRDGTLVVEAGQASLRVKEQGTRLSLAGAARLRREQRGVRLMKGTAAFEVEPRRGKDAPFRVFVSGGRIEVLGTRFTVVQDDGSGEVTLASGSIRFVDLEGREALLAPGQRLRWPPAPPPAPTGEARPAPTPVTPPPPPPPTAPRPSRAHERPPPAPPPQPQPPPLPPEEALAQQRRFLAEIDGLRIRREDDRLVKRLDEMLADGVPEPLRERLSFERCDVLAHEAGGERRACDEIERHLVRYSGGEYTSRLLQSRHALGCRP